jgi:hypothetical protein
LPGIPGPYLVPYKVAAPWGSRRPEYIALGKIIPGNAAAQSRLGTVLRTGAGSSPRRKKDFKIEIFLAHVDTNPRSPAKKEAVSGSCSEQDEHASGFCLGRPRAGAHVWGKGARILTEINRLPQSTPSSAALIWGRRNGTDYLAIRGRADLLATRACFY